MNKIWLVKLRARLKLRRWKFILRHTPDAVMSGGKGGSSTDTSFQRQGTDNKISGFTIPPGLISLIDSASGALDLGAGDPHASFLSRIITQDPTAYPGAAQIQSIMSQNATTAPWYNNMLSTAMRDPFSSTYEADTQGAYVNRLNNTMSEMDSAAVRTGTNHNALFKGQAMADANRDRSADLARQRSTDAGIIGGSTNLLQQWQQGQQGQQLQASGMANQSQNARIAQALEAGQQRTSRASSALGGLTQSARLRGSQNETVNTNLSGKGYQEGSQWNAGASVGDVCCFIFMESLNGPLAWYVRQGRNDFQTKKGVAGYRWMSNWLIPLMRKYSLVQKIVNTTMVKPIMQYGRYKYCGENPRWGWAFKPVLHAWLGVWKTLGGLGYAR